MNNRAEQRTVKRVMALLGLGLVAYIIVPPIYWHFSDFITATIPSSSSSSSSSSDCPPCFCDCSSQPLLALSDDGLSINTSFAGMHEKGPGGEPGDGRATFGGSKAERGRSCKEPTTS
ncbi:hypothetical protein LINGRAPRIM_LOCUS620 [Linum grandiflorum]